MKHFTNVSMPRKAAGHEDEGLLDKIQGFIENLMPSEKNEEE